MADFSQYKRFLSAHNVASLVCFGLYLLLRWKIDWAQAPKRYLRNADHLWYWEKRTGQLLIGLVASKYFWRTTLDAWLAEALAYCKLAAVVVLGAADYRLGVLMALWIVMSYLLFVQPRYSGAQKVDVMTPASFDSQALSEHPSQPVWLVMLTASWSPQCREWQPTFAEISLEYASDKLRFGELDVGRWPKMAKKYGMSIDTAPQQLPTFLLLKQGKLLKRLPEADGAWKRKGRLKGLLVAHFDLDMMLAATLQPQ